jgi:catechol 2,3-dioxygenase
MPAVGHVHLKVSDLERSQAFYRAALGLELSEQVGGSFVFTSFGDAHHDLALQAHPDALGLYHFAIEVADEAELARAVDRVREAGVEFTAVDHGISKSIYFSDPDGHGVEIYCDARQLRHRPEWEGIAAPWTSTRWLASDYLSRRSISVSTPLRALPRCSRVRSSRNSAALRSPSRDLIWLAVSWS